MVALPKTPIAGRVPRFLGVAVLALIGLTCRDKDLMGPGLPQRARLAVVPHFGVATSEMPTVRLSKVKAEVFRIPSGDRVLDDSAFFAPNDTSVELSLTVGLLDRDEQFRVRVSAWDESTPPNLVFVGEDTMRAAPMDVPQAPHSIRLQYAGPDSVVKAVSVQPKPDTVITFGDSTTFRAFAKRSDSSVVAASIGWTSRDTNVVTINRNTGRAYGKAEGANVWIVATSFTGKQDSLRVSVTQEVATVTVTPSPAEVILGRSLQLVSSVKDAAGRPMPLRRTTWTSADTTIVTVSETGMIVGVALGTTIVSVTSGSVTTPVTVSVIRAPVFRVLVTPTATSLFVGDVTTPQVRLEDDLGNELSGRFIVWSSLNTAVATVDPVSGQVTGRSAGSATIVATSEGKTGSMVVTVQLAASALIVADAAGVFGGVAPLTATLSSRGAPLPNRTISFLLNGTIVGTAITDANGVAQLSATLAGIAAGTYAATATPPGVQANFASDGIVLAVSGNATLTVTRAVATLSLGSLTHVYDGSPKSATVTTTPAGLGVVTVTYTPSGGAASTTPPTAAGNYAVTASLSHPNYVASDVSGTMVISAGTQTIAFAPLSARTFGEAPFALTATASSGLAVSFAASGNCSVSGNVVTLTAAGNCTITASQPGDANYSAAVSVSQSFAIGKATATITLAGLSQVYDGTPRSATATTSPAGLAVTITYDGTPAAPTNAGSYAVIATLNDSNYTAASATGTLVISQATATITLDGLAQTYDGGQRVVTATVTPAISGFVEITYDGSVDAPVNAGSYAVVATLTDSNYAGTVTGTLVVAKGTPTISWSNPADITYGTPLDGTQLNARASFGNGNGGLVLTDVIIPPLAGSYAYTPPAGTVLAAGAGQVLSVVFTADDPNLNTASATVTINVLPPAVAGVTLSPASDTVVVGDSVAYNAVVTDGSGAIVVQTVVWTVADSTIATVSNTGWVRGVAAGVTSVIATSEGKADTSSVLVLDAIDRTYISPTLATLRSINDSLQLTAQSYAGDFGRAGTYTWVSRNPSVASVSASGLVVAHANGVTYVVVTEAGGTKDSSQITVQQQVSTVTVTPVTRTLYYGTQFQLTANAIDGRGNPISGILFGWSSNAPAVVAVNEAGMVTTQAATTQSSVVASVTATAGGVTGVSTITAVTAIQRIAVTPDTLTLNSLGLPQRYTAVAYDTLDAPMSGITFTWQSTNPSVAPLDSATATTVRAVSAANGVSTIRATAQGVTGSASLKVQQVLASIEVTPPMASIAPTGSVALVARGKDANSRYINGGTFSWTSSQPTYASVNATTGVVTGVAVGNANITAATGSIVSNDAAITVTNTVAPSISFGRDTLGVGRGTSTSIPLYLSTPSASPVVVNLSARDTVAYFSVAKVTFPANTTTLNVTLNGRNAGTTQVYATDSALVYAGDTAAVAVQATMRLSVASIYVNAGDQYATQVLLSDPSPAGGTYVTFSYSTAGRASVSPDPAFIPAGQLAADIVIRSLTAGTTYVTPVASGVNGTATYFDAAPAVLGLNVYTQRLGVGQYEPNNYVYTQRNLTASLPVALTTSDTTVARTAAIVTIPANSSYAYFTTSGLQTGTARTIATAPGWQPDTFFTTVTTPRLGICCGSALNTTSPVRTVTIYAQDSLRTAHYRINSLVVSLRSTDTSVIKVLDTLVTIGAGQYYNGSGRIAPAGGAGSAWVVATAGGHFADSSQYSVVGPNLYLNFSTYMLGAGQNTGTGGAYVYTADAVTTPLTVTLTSGDSSKVATIGSVTIPAGQSYAYFQMRALATTASAVQLRATASGYTPDTGYVTVTSPRVTSSGGGTLNNFSDATWFTIYTTDSLGTGRYLNSPVRFTLVSSDTSIIKIDSAAITVPAGGYSNTARVRAVGVGTARIYVTGPAGYINDSSIVYTVITPTVNLSWYRNYMGLRQTSGSNAVYVYTPNNRPDPVYVSIVQKHPEWVRLIGADSSITIPANRNYEYFAYDGIGLGTDTIIVTADGYQPDTAFITVTTPKLTTSGLPSNATTTTPPQWVYVYATDSLGTGHYVMDTVTLRAVSSDSNVIKPDSEYVHIVKGQYYRAAGVRFVGPGTASITYSDSAGLYRPITTNVVNVTGPSLRVSTSYSMLGMRQYQDQYVYTDNNVTGAPLVVRLLSTDTRVASVPDSLIIPVGSNFAYFRMTALDTVGTIQIQATATGYYAVNTTLQVTQPKFVISTSGSMWTTSPPQAITVYATDANGTGHYVVDSVPVTLTSSAPSVAAPDSSLVWITPGQYYNNIARMRPGVVGTTQLTASDSRAATYSYNPGSASVTVNLPSISFSYSTDVLGVGQYIDHYVYVPDAVTSPLTVTLTHLGSAKTSIPSSVTIASGYNYAYFRAVGSSLGVDTIRASAPGHNPATSFITVGTGRIDPIAGWPATLRAGVDTVLLTLYTRDQNQNGRYVNDSTTFALSPSANLQFLSYPAKAPITGLTVPPGQYYMYFYVTGVSAGTGSATITNALYSPYTPGTITISP